MWYCPLLFQWFGKERTFELVYCTTMGTVNIGTLPLLQ